MVKSSNTHKTLSILWVGLYCFVVLFAPLLHSHHHSGLALKKDTKLELKQAPSATTHSATGCDACHFHSTKLLPANQSVWELASTPGASFEAPYFSPRATAVAFPAAYFLRGPPQG